MYNISLRENTLDGSRKQTSRLTRIDARGNLIRQPRDDAK